MFNLFLTLNEFMKPSSVHEVGGVPEWTFVVIVASGVLGFSYMLYHSVKAQKQITKTQEESSKQMLYIQEKLGKEIRFLISELGKTIVDSNQNIFKSLEQITVERIRDYEYSKSKLEDIKEDLNYIKQRYGNQNERI